ncbi:DNA-formamidopyrimidine glycosylase [Candidatus Nomurabacteria bacterium RIFCSPLOWO2_01_FULL_41_21]|uniref:Formamidopyrimidine-DNA glycosylase n=2 Tax=Candidatus Nomuraibacteriota TaxID=1752729 RepID=A0A1F6V3G7_9BACT|nr:MAG: DNA-formamidopyrimidine glycosylase [Candidatus Nomurabacteria bacterium RIFCSPHIGHO2_01_FULL_40_20]OGI88315.1 MAG: DNA-formamidopyrimidine glycosylase [Candidatus Nomurabacteria bacterium RIFCSPLOWO2_01_FULL_41_21]
MPELPEVENLRRGLEKSILGQIILKVEVNKPKLVSGKGTLRSASKKKKQEFTNGLTGEKFVAVERRAKNLIFKLNHDKIILAHMKMTGQFAYLPSRKASARQARKNRDKKVMGGHPIELSESTLPNKHTHIIFHLEKGALYYNDTRMFGYVLYYPNEKEFEKENHFIKLGVEPLDKIFTAKYFAESLKNKKGKIKSVIMSQDVVTGVGNIYADESLFEARIDPRRSSNTLRPKEVEKLHDVIIDIMKRAIRAGGSSVATYRLLDETRGNYAREHKVYGKAGLPCSRCGKPLQKILIQTRTTIFCPRCQK